MYENYKWVIFDSIESGSVDVSEVIASGDNHDHTQITGSNQSFSTDRDGNLCYVKYLGEMPSSVLSLSTKSSEYTQSEILDIFVDTWDPQDYIVNDWGTKCFEFMIKSLNNLNDIYHMIHKLKV